MPTLRNIPILLLLTFVSCGQKPADDYKESIIGEWIFVKESPKNQTDDIPPPPSWREHIGGYSFLSGNICENKLGYFKGIEGISRYERRYLFLGTFTKYEIQGDSLKIFNLSDSSWSSKGIVSITASTMTLRAKDSTIFLYSKINRLPSDSAQYDEIIISASGCYGNCPANDIAINRQGQVIYFGDRYNTVNGMYKSTVSPKEFSIIESDFKKSDILGLKDNYSASWTDDETVSVTFIKDHRIVKSIRDYGRQSPPEFYWAYTSARYLYQNLQLDTMPTRFAFPPFNYTTIETHEKAYELSQSDSFYLWTLLLNSTETNHAIRKDYLMINYLERGKQEMATDGQFFKMTLQDGSERVYDLGFNFITQNGFDKRLRLKKQDY